MRRHSKRAAVIATALVVSAGSVRADRDGDDDDTGAEAKAALPMKIDDLIEVAVRLAPDLSRARIDRNIARDNAAAARRQQAWVVSMEARYSQDAYADHVDLPLFAPVATQTVLGSLGIGRALPTGGQLQFGVDIQHQTQELNVPTGLTISQQQQQSGTGMGSSMDPNAGYEFKSSAQTAARLTFKQPLARGFGRDVALATERKADLAAAEATIDAQLAAEKMVKEIVVAYWDLANAAYTVDVRKQALELAQHQHEITREEVRGGLVAPNAINSVKYEIATREEALLSAQTDYEAKSLDLRRKVGLQISRRDIVLRPGEAFDLTKDEEIDIDDVIARSRRANRQLAQIALQKKVAELELFAAEDLTKPQLDLQLQGAVLGQGGGVGDAVGTVGDSFQVMASLSFSYEISGAARKGRDAARAKRRRLDIDRADAERQIDVAIVAAAHQVSAARKRVDLSEQAIVIAEENVRSERASFAANKSSNYQVMQRTGQLIDAKLRRGKAITEYHQAVAQLEFLGGTLLERYRIDVRPRASR